MLLAQSPAPAADLLVLAFVAGFAVATLVFWPLLQRTRRLTNQRGGSSTGARQSTESRDYPESRDYAESREYIAATPQKAQFSAVRSHGETHSGSGGSHRLDVETERDADPTDEHASD